MRHVEHGAQRGDREPSRDAADGGCEIGFALDAFKVVKGTTTFDDTFTQGPPPVGGYFGSNLLAFNANNGSIDPEVNG